MYCVFVFEFSKIDNVIFVLTRLDFKLLLHCGTGNLCRWFQFRICRYAVAVLVLCESLVLERFYAEVKQIKDQAWCT